MFALRGNEMMHAFLLIFAVIAAFCSAGLAGETRGAPLWVYVGGKNAIALFRLDPGTNALEPRGEAAGIGSGFFAFSPDERFLYALTSTVDANKKHVDEVIAFAVDRATGKLNLLNRQPTQGDAACFVAVDPQGKNVLVANYSSATVAVFPLSPDGTLRPASCVIKQTGSSVNPTRQNHAYAHSVNLDRAGRFAFVADLGADKLFVYRFDSATGVLTPNDPPSVSVPPGSGPRHFSFAPEGRFAYLVNEMGNSVIAYSYDAAKGALAEVQEIGTLPGDFKGNSTCAEVLVHPSGRFVYVSNRGDSNFITIYSVDGASGKLAIVGYQPTLGKTPRNFRIDPSGRFMVVGNQDSNSIVLFSIDPGSGKLAAIGEPVATVEKPICVKFLTAMPQ
jgi:6-phosphogluconolactonase